MPSIPITFPQVPVSTKPREKREELLKTETSRLDAFFAVPAVAVAMAIVCNMLWGAAFPFIKMGYRLFAIDAADTPSILCFAGVRFMLGAVLVCAVLIVRMLMDTTMHSEEDVDRYLQLPVLASVPYYRDRQ